MSDVFGTHPSDDALADLAAEVLPAEEARSVERHVIGCSRCADLLADAERIRRLLLADDPGPMPEDVWNRLELTLAAEVEARYYDPTYVAPPPEEYLEAVDPPAVAGWGSPAPWDEVPDYPEAPTSQWNRFVLEEAAAAALVPAGDTPVADAPAKEPRASRTARDDADADDGSATDEAPARGSASSRRPADPEFEDEDDEDDTFSAQRRSRGPRLPGRPNLRSVGSLRSRRDVRAEDRVSPLVRYGRPLGIAAGVIAIAGLGGYAVTIMPGGSNSSGTSGGAALSAASGEAPVAEGASAAAAGGAADSATSYALSKEAAADLLSASGTKYTKNDFSAQAMALPQVNAGAPRAGDGSGGGASAAASAPSAPAPAAPSTSAGASVTRTTVAAKGDPGTVGGNKSLLDPKVLAGCLTGIGKGQAQPIAVDLATYEGADAAILVFAGRDGGYEVYVVRRTCNQDSADALNFKDVPPK